MTDTLRAWHDKQAELNEPLKQASMKKIILQFAPYIALIAALFYIYANSSFYPGNDTPTVQIDSVKVTKPLPEKTGTFQNAAPQPTIVVLPSQQQTQNNTAETNKILALIQSLQGNQDNLAANQEQMQILLEIIAKKEYAKVYEDSIVKIEVKNTVENGKKTAETVNWKVKESFVDYYEKKYTYKLKPKFMLSAGLGVNSAIDINAEPQLEALLGFKNKKGYELQLGYSTDKRASLALKKDLFTKYEKPTQPP